MAKKIRAPVDTRDLLNLFVAYDASLGLASIMDCADIAQMTRRQVYFTALGRSPENWTLAVEEPAYSAREHLQSALTSPEFQDRIRELILEAFPEKRRLIFVHIPKCAGTDLVETLRLQAPWVHYHLSRPAECSKDQLFSELREILIKMNFYDSIAVTGHVPLRWYIERKLVRFYDDLFTTVREPVSIMYSYINFILSRLVQFRGIERADTTEWLQYLGLREIPEGASNSYLRDLASHILRNTDITSRNMICSFLGAEDVSADTARANCITSDIEIVDTKCYSKWRKQRWNVDWEERMSESALRILSADTISSKDREYLFDATEQDRRFYDLVSKALRKNDSLSVRGRELA